MAVNWQLGVMPDAGGNAMRSFEQGVKIGSELRKRKAISAWSQNPDDPNTLNALIAAAPELGFKAAEYQRDRAKDARETQFNDALGSYLGGNAMLGFGGTAPVTSRNALATPPSAVPSTGNAPDRPQPVNLEGEPVGPRVEGGRAPVSQPTAGPVAPVQPNAPDLSFLGRPESREDAMFLRMVRADPKRALEIESKLRDRFMGRLKDEHEGIGYGLTTLAGVDATTWGQRRAHIIQRLAPLNLNLEAVLPEQYPGEEGVRQIQMQGMGLKDQLAELINQDKADAYVENIDADNARADRNTDSIIADRAARRGIQRRGQDIRSADTRRGQDKRGSGRLVQVKTRAEAEALPPGTRFRDPNGVVRTRP